MGLFNNAIEYDGVYSAVQSLLDSGKTLDDISLRDIRGEMGDRGSLSTISKYFGPIKVRLERGEAVDMADLSDTDVDALRAMVRDIVVRRTFLERKEKEDSAQAMSDIIRANEIDLAMKDEVIDAFRHEVFALEGESGAQMLEIKELNAQVSRLEGMVEALNATIAALAVPREVAAAKTAVPIKFEPSATSVAPRKSGQAEMPPGTGNADGTSDDAGDGQG